MLPFCCTSKEIGANDASRLTQLDVCSSRQKVNPKGVDETRPYQDPLLAVELLNYD